LQLATSRRRREAIVTTNPKRGDVWWAMFDERRAVVLLSDHGSEFRAMQVVAPAGTSIEGVAAEVRIGAREGLPEDGVLRVALPRPGQINCNWLVNLSPSDLIGRAGELSPQTLEAVEKLLRFGALA
jgi:mRNA interferase MazF